MNHFNRYVIFGKCFLTILPITPLIIPGVDLMYPMQIEYYQKPNASINYYINFGAQTLAFGLYVIIHFIQLVIFFVLNTNVLFELKMIANLCRKIGSSGRSFHWVFILLLNNLQKIFSKSFYGQNLPRDDWQDWSKACPY